MRLMYMMNGRIHLSCDIRLRAQSFKRLPVIRNFITKSVSHELTDLNPGVVSSHMDSDTKGTRPSGLCERGKYPRAPPPFISK